MSRAVCSILQFQVRRLFSCLASYVRPDATPAPKTPSLAQPLLRFRSNVRDACYDILATTSFLLETCKPQRPVDYDTPNEVRADGDYTSLWFWASRSRQGLFWPRTDGIENDRSCFVVAGAMSR